MAIVNRPIKEIAGLSSIIVNYMMFVMNNKTELLVVGGLLLVLGGCVSDNDFAAVHAQVHQLNSQVEQLRKGLAVTQEELSAIKKQRVVRLPVGSPSKIEARESSISLEDSLYMTAVSAYRDGDLQTAIDDFEQFNSNYPNSIYHERVLYYLGQAHYTARNYNRAAQVLAELVYQNHSLVNERQAIELLKQVYQGQGNRAGLARLQKYLTARQTAQSGETQGTNGHLTTAQPTPGNVPIGGRYRQTVPIDNNRPVRPVIID